MASLVALPRELLHRICLYADVASCKNLRLTCPLLRDIGRHWVFRNITVNIKKTNCENVGKILNDPDLAQCVTKVYFDIMEWLGDWGDHSEDEDEDEEESREDMGEDITVLPKPFRNLMDRLREFPRLQGVALCFHHECAVENDWAEPPQDTEFRASMIERLMSRLVQLPRLPRELGILNLQNINTTEPAVVANITKVLQSLQSLRLNIVHEHSEGNGETDIENTEPHTFLSELPSFWLKPTISNLQHLTLYSSMYFGFYPALDLSSTHFPHLKSLALGNFTFIHDSQLDWILSHASTLTSLYLDDCPILVEVAVYSPERTLLPASSFSTHPKLPSNKKWLSYSKRWKDYFRAFQDGLPHLRQFRYGHAEQWWEKDSTPFEAETGIRSRFGRESYMVYCDGFGPSQYMERMIYTIQNGEEREYEDGERLRASEEDQEALRELRRSTGQVEVQGGEDEDDYDY